MRREAPLDDACRGVRRVVLAMLLISISGCGRDDPETRAIRTAKAFVSAVRTSDTKTLITLLEADSVTQLEQSAARASEHVGGRRTIEAHEMLQVIDLDPLFQVEGIEVLDLDAQLAVVEVRATSGEKQTLTLVDDGGQWKIRVPSPSTGAASTSALSMTAPP